MDAAYVLSEKISPTTASWSSQLGCFRSKLSAESSETTAFISSQAPRHPGTLRTLWNGSFRFARRSKRLLASERRVLRRILNRRRRQSRGQTADRCGSTEILRAEPDRLPTAPPGIV